jgi:hypothetical protein
VSWSHSIHWVPRASHGRRQSSPHHCHGIGRSRGHLLLRGTIDKRVERMSTQWNQGRWDLGRSRTGQGGPCTMSNGRRKCVRNDDSAVTFIRWITWKIINLTTHMLEKSVTISHVDVKKRFRRTRRSKKLKRR